MLALRSIFAERVALFARKELARSTTLIDAGLAVNSSAHRGMKARPDGTAPQVILALTIGLNYRFNYSCGRAWLRLWLQ
jgi:hypothetical protein